MYCSRTKYYIDELVDAGYTVGEYKDILHNSFEYRVSKDGVQYNRTMTMCQAFDDDYTYRALRDMVNKIDDELSRQAKIIANSVYGNRIYDYDTRSMYPSMYMIPARQNGKSQLFADMMDAIYRNKKKEKEMNKMKIKNVIFNNPATIVFWADGSKTVVQCQPGDVYDPEKGLAMAITKKALGNQGNYCNIFKKWIPDV